MFTYYRIEVIILSRGFSAEEKEQIRKNLINEGRELFIRYGLKKTGIRELADKAGIAQGSFYKFFSSKEELFFEILEKEGEKIKERLFSSSFIEGEIDKEELRNFLYKSFEIMDNNPLLKKVYTEEEYQLLLKRVPDQKMNDHFIKDENVFLPIIKKAQKKGKMINKKPQIIMSLLRSIFLLTLHKKEIDPEYYEETMYFLIDLIVEGLIKGGENYD